MRRTVILAPELFHFGALRQKFQALPVLAELGMVFRLNPLPDIETPEALWLGLGPGEGQLRQGPLTVAALGADPPERSLHFHLTPMTFEDGRVVALPYDLPPEDLRSLLAEAKRLNTPSLTLVEGIGLDHGLVWESLGDLRTHPAAKISGSDIGEWWPEGDGDQLLRRYIDDSVNLLSPLELNQRRTDDGLPPVNLLWPWGHGVRMPVPNLALRRGGPAWVYSQSLRLAGLTRLAGYRHGDRASFGSGTATRIDDLASQMRSHEATLAMIDAPEAFLQSELADEANWFAAELDSKLLRVILDDALTSQIRICLLAPGKQGGIGLRFQSGDSGTNSNPFDERLLEDSRVSALDVWDVVRQALLP